MKQTAVEWLREKLWKEFNFSFSDNILEQAKEMEKEQIVDFGYDIAEDLAWGKYKDKKAMEERYNEYLTFKSE
jgi:hypothetical protein